MIKITEQEFDDVIKEGLVAVKLYGDWCGFCTKLAPILDEVEKGLTTVKFYALHVNRGGAKDSPVCQKYNVTGFPRLLMFKDGKLAGEMKGFKQKPEVINILNSTLLGYNNYMEPKITHIKLTLEDANKVLGYLGSKPYVEAAPLIDLIGKAEKVYEPKPESK
jgi:thioredoxin 1